MFVRTFEIRDRHTFIPVMAFSVEPCNRSQHYLLRRAGYDFNTPSIMVIQAATCRANYDPHGWEGRTMPVAHEYIVKNWHRLLDGDVIDVEYILGEAAEPKKSESETVPA